MSEPYKKKRKDPSLKPLKELTSPRVNLYIMINKRDTGSSLVKKI